jgi:thioesterase domain-containing protein
MSVSSSIDLAHNTSALFGRVSRNSERVILPVNDSAVGQDSRAPAFYCVHSASGVAGTDFLALARRFEPSIRFYGIQAPAKHMLDAQFGSSVESLADHYVDALEKFQPQGAIVLGGYCVGAIIALAMAHKLRARGRDVGPLIVIDGVPENTGVALSRWTLPYWRDLARNLRGWLRHGDLMRSRTLRSLLWSLSNNAYTLGRSAVGLKRGEKFGGGYAIDGIMDLSPYEPAHRQFINRLFNALFFYVPAKYSGAVIVYEAKITPLLYLPQIGRIWRTFAPQSEVINIVATHIGMMREPYVDALATDMRKRIARYFSAMPRSGS